jgi:hypothetical protein
MSRKHPRQDLNHQDVVAAFRKLHCLVQDSSSLGDGFPDLIVMCRRQVFLVEIKNNKGTYGRQGLNPNQQKFVDDGWLVHLVTSLDDVVNFVNGKRILAQPSKPKLVQNAS